MCGPEVQAALLEPHAALLRGLEFSSSVLDLLQTGAKLAK
jgi:hypothetical protein